MDRLNVELWTWPLDVAQSERERLTRLLSDDEHARADRFIFDIHANRYRVGRGRLREILGTQLSLAPKEVCFAYGENGKPELAAPLAETELQFNLSNSADLAALAVCRGPDIGVDIEFVRPIEDDVAKLHFSPAEYAELSRLQGQDWLSAFYRCWTRKEAMVKALGDGLFLPLDSFDVTIGADAPARLLRLADEPDPQAWMLHHFDPAPDCIGAIACNSVRPLQVTHHVA